ncbi:MAG: aldehyde ferredoxin oxidoreductase N-terminal domain-containing protein, partial [Thermosphaera sp.]
MKGWWGRILHVDLSSGKTREIRLDPSVYAEYIGGRGLAARLLWDFVPQGADP